MNLAVTPSPTGELYRTINVQDDQPPDMSHSRLLLADGLDGGGARLQQQLHSLHETDIHRMDSVEGMVVPLVLAGIWPPAENYMFCLASGKQRGPNKSISSKRGANYGEVIFLIISFVRGGVPF